MDDLIERAKISAQHWHWDQKRKYTGLPYFTHLVEVAQIVSTVTSDKEMIAAALLHDAVEDTEATIEDIEKRFGRVVAKYVSDLTDIARPEHGNRAARAALNRAHTAEAHQNSKTIKLADLISNSKDITQHDPDFAKVYLREKELLLDCLQEGDPQLLKQAQDLLIQCKLHLLEEKNANTTNNL